MRSFFLFIVIVTATFVGKPSLYGEQTSEPQEFISSTETYRVIKKLGSGAFGEVYAVVNSEDMPFAIKTYKKSDDKHSFNNIEKELFIGQFLDHPNILKAYDLFTYGDTECVVLQYVEGETLLNIEKGKVDARDAVQHVKNLSNALSYALSYDLLHLDLHPNNVMVGLSEGVMVIDLGSFYTIEEFAMWINSFSKPETKAEAMDPRMAARQQKIGAFMERNPKLLERLKTEQQTEVSIGEESAVNIAKRGSTEKSAAFKNSFKEYMTLLYCDQMTDICLFLISKSDLEKHEKLETMAAIKKIFWLFRDDVEDGCEAPLQSYFDELLQTLSE